MKTLYTAEATVTGGRHGGHGQTSDGQLDVQLCAPPELGGEGGGTNPEQLFAVGFAACFENALRLAARRAHIEAEDSTVLSRVMLMRGEDRGFKLAVALDISLPSVAGEQAIELTRAAHKVCPYSHATRGNIDVTLTVNGRELLPPGERRPVAAAPSASTQPES
jgi:lipoyl-dependent peroxiredoxin